MTKYIVFVFSILNCGFVQAQRPSSAIPPVVNLGEVVIDVVVAKALTTGSETELMIAKFGRIETNVAVAPIRTEVTFKTEKRTRKLIVNGKSIEREYTVQIPVVNEVVVQKENGNSANQQRSFPASAVQAFDLKGNSIDREAWIKSLEKPRHVLLLKEPIGEMNKLNPFFSEILREDTLLLFLTQYVDEQNNNGPMVTSTYDVQDFAVWWNDGENVDPTTFIDLIKSKVTPGSWNGQTSISPVPGRKWFTVTGNAATHRELNRFFTLLRKDMIGEEK